VSNRLGIAIAITIVVVFLAALGAVVMRSSVGSLKSDAEPGTGVAQALDGANAASPPFAGLTEARLALGDRCLKVAIADEDDERVQGLRDITDLGDYDGMLFVYSSDTDARFTMARTPLPLDITWYAPDGRPVSSTTMRPCVEGSDATCPVYASAAKYRYALETAAGHGGSGAIGACPG
jgi:uncharacterized membrane protein (UPF0127 family)